jgi:hypothetical protein
MLYKITNNLIAVDPKLYLTPQPSLSTRNNNQIAHFVPIVSKHGYHRNLVGSIYGMSSMKIAHFIPEDIP